jgi:hypothetical protein
MLCILMRDCAQQQSNSNFCHQGAICENKYLAITPYVFVVKVQNFCG